MIEERSLVGGNKVWWCKVSIFLSCYIIYNKVYAFLRLTEIKRRIKNAIKLKISLEKFW